MHVELLVVPECPNEAGAMHLLRTALSGIGLPDVSVTTTTIATQAEAERKRFVGSPTFLVDGTDLSEEPGRPAGLSCRLYQRAEGPRGLPELDALRRALQQAAGRADTPNRSPHGLSCG